MAAHGVGFPLVATFCLSLLLSPQQSWGQPLAAIPSQGSAQPSSTAEVMSLGELIASAIRHEPSLARASVDVEIANAQLLAETGMDDWRLAVKGSVLSTRLQPFNVEYDEYKLQADLQRGIPSGGSVRLHAETGYIGTSLPLPGVGDTYQNMVSATLSHPLLRGRGPGIARAPQEKARIARTVAELQQGQVANGTVLRVVQAYWALAYAHRALDIARNNLSLAQTLLDNTLAGIETGTVEESAALPVQQSVATREGDVLRAEIAITRASLNLRKLAGLEIGPRAIDIAIAAPLAHTPRQLRIDALIEEAFANSPEIALLEARLEGAAVDIRVAEDNSQPALDLSLTLGAIGVSDGPGSAFRSMVSFDDLMIGASLTLEHDLGGRASQGSSRQVHARMRQARLDLAAAKARLAQAVIEAAKQAELAQKQIELDQRIVALAEQNVEAERARFELGRSTSFDVLQRQDDLQQAELRQARSIVEYLEAVSLLDALLGALVPKYGVTLEMPNDAR